VAPKTTIKRLGIVHPKTCGPTIGASTKQLLGHRHRQSEHRSKVHCDCCRLEGLPERHRLVLQVPELNSRAAPSTTIKRLGIVHPGTCGPTRRAYKFKGHKGVHRGKLWVEATGAPQKCKRDIVRKKLIKQKTGEDPLEFEIVARHFDGNGFLRSRESATQKRKE